MNTGKETWKWGLVALLLAIFLITANQAYQHVANQEVYEAPDDWTKGDSWDQEHQGGPGAGQPMQLTTDYSNSQTTPTVNQSSNSDLSEGLTSPDQIILEDNIDWNQSDSDSNSQNKVSAEPVAEDKKISPKPENNSVQPEMYEIFSAPSAKEATASEPINENPTVSNDEPITETTKDIPASENNSSTLSEQTSSESSNIVEPDTASSSD